MTKQQEKVLIAALAGLVITAAAAFAISPAMVANPAHTQIVLVAKA